MRTMDSDDSGSSVASESESEDDSGSGEGGSSDSEEDEASSGETEESEDSMSDQSDESDSQPQEERVGWRSVPTLKQFDQVKRGDQEGRKVMEKLVQEYMDLAQKVSNGKTVFQPQHWKAAIDYRCFADQTNDNLLHIFLHREDGRVDRIVVSPASAAGMAMAMLDVALFASPNAAIYTKTTKEVKSAFERTLKQLKQVSFSIKE